MEFWVVRRTKRLWTGEEKRSICLQTTAPDVSVAQVARRYALNANMIFKWLRDARYAPGSAQGAVDAPVFLPVEIVNPARSEVARAVLPASTLPASTLPASTLPASTLPASILPASTLPASILPASTLPASILPASILPASILPASILPASILPASILPDGLLEIEIAGGHRLRVSGAYDPEALAQLIRGLSG